jgi:hypothetical protein
MPDVSWRTMMRDSWRTMMRDHPARPFAGRRGARWKRQAAVGVALPIGWALRLSGAYAIIDIQEVRAAEVHCVLEKEADAIVLGCAPRCCRDGRSGCPARYPG